MAFLRPREFSPCSVVVDVLLAASAFKNKAEQKSLPASEGLSLSFVKMHGLGNDFLMVEDAELLRLADVVFAGSAVSGARFKQFCSLLTARVCDRHFGVGGDGMIVAVDLGKLQRDGQKERHKDTASGAALHSMLATYPAVESCELAWLYINSDGSYAEMCGNGLRCLGHFIANTLKWVEDSIFTVATAVSPVSLEIVQTDTKSGAASVRTRLAGAVFDGESDNDSGLQTITVRGEQLQITSVSMGNPHCVVFEQDVLGLPALMDIYAKDISAAHSRGGSLQKFPAGLVSLAEDIQSLSTFPRGVNVEFVRATGADTALTFVVERGCGPTLACASGAAAVLAAGVKTNRLNKKSYVILPGGKLEASLISLADAGNFAEHIDLVGPAVQVFAGVVALPEGFAAGAIAQSASEVSGQ